MTNDETTTPQPNGDGGQTIPQPPEQVEMYPYQPMRTTAEAEGTIGGEAHAAYAFFAVEGQKLTLHFSWGKTEGEDEPEHAGISIDDGTGEFNEEAAGFSSNESGREVTTSGTIPRTATYRITVVAHFIADYKFRLRLE